MEPYSEEWLGGEAHVGHVDPRPPILQFVKNFTASRAFILGFGLASGLTIGIGLVILLTRRPRA